MASSSAEGIILESDLRAERAEWLKTQIEGSEQAKTWKVKCKTVYELVKSKFTTATQVEAGKIAKKAFPFIKRQNCHQRDGTSESYYYRVRCTEVSTREVDMRQTEPVWEKEKERIPELEGNLLEKEIAIQNKQLKRMACSYATSVKKIKSLEKQKQTLASIVNELEENILHVHAKSSQNGRQNIISSQHDFQDTTGIDYIPKGHMTSHSDCCTVIGSGSYGTCELMNYKNIKVCVKKLHKNADVAEVKHEAAILKHLQQSLFVPVLLGINLISTPFYIVTKFHSHTMESSLTLHKAIKKCTIGKNKWVSILYKCALGVQSIHKLGIIHNDLHQKNIILDRLNGHVHPIIIDFGKACGQGNGRCRKVDDIDMYTQLHPWVAPETICGEHTESELSDVYGFGYIMLKVNSIAQVDSLGNLISLCQSTRSQRPAVNDIVESLKTIASAIEKKMT